MAQKPKLMPCFPQGSEAASVTWEVRKMDPTSAVLPFCSYFCLESDGWSGKENPEVTKWWGESVSGRGEVPGHARNHRVIVLELWELLNSFLLMDGLTIYAGSRRGPKEAKQPAQGCMTGGGASSGLPVWSSLLGTVMIAGEPICFLLHLRSSC